MAPANLATGICTFPDRESSSSAGAVLGTGQVRGPGGDGRGCGCPHPAHSPQYPPGHHMKGPSAAPGLQKALQQQ